MPAEPDISIVIINWRSVGFLEKCLSSIRANSANVTYEIIVVDNASFDGCAQMLVTNFPTVRFIQAQQNLGFAKANNLAFEYTTSRNVLFLNPDTEIVGDALATLVRAADSTSRAGALGPKLLNTDRSLQMSVQAFPSILNQVLDADYLRAKFPNSRLWGMKALFDDGSSLRAVDALSGACLLVRRTAFEKVKRFTEDYFMYAEDVDLCYKIELARLARYFVADAVVVHHGGKSSDASEEKNFANIQQRESRLRYFLRNKGKLYAYGYRLAIAGSAAIRLAVIGSLYLTVSNPQRSESLPVAFRKWKGIFKWSMGFVAWAAKNDGQFSKGCHERS